MVTRLIVILALALQPLLAAGGLTPSPCGRVDPGSGAAAAAADSAGCCGGACCCREAGEPCPCAVDEGPGEPPKPGAPPANPAPKTQLLLAIPAPAVPIAAVCAAAPHRTAEDARPFQSHNQRQSLLCVWRT